MRDEEAIFSSSLARMGCLALLCASLTTTALFSPSSASAQTPILLESQKLLASDGAWDDFFGSDDSVAVSGDTAVVGAYGNDDNGSESGSAYVFRYDGSEWVEEAKLTAPDGAYGDRFGRSVAVSGDTAVIGAAYDDRGTGSAHVFRYDGSDWVKEAKLTASDRVAGDYFGFSVAASGDTVVIGSSGSAYVFRYDGNEWVEEAKLTASDGAWGDQFGFSVAASGDTVVIGSSGSAYVFRYDGSDWVEEAKLTASDGAWGDGFGESVAVSGDTAVVGAYRDGVFDDSRPNFGAAYVFRYDGSDWVEEVKLTASDAAYVRQFGYSVAVSGDTAVVGGYGSAYVFGYDGSDWVEELKLAASDGFAANLFGHSVAVSGDTAVVGATNDDANGWRAGSAYVFQLIPPPLPHDQITVTAEIEMRYGYEENLVVSAPGARTAVAVSHGSYAVGPAGGYYNRFARPIVSFLAEEFAQVADGRPLLSARLQFTLTDDFLEPGEEYTSEVRLFGTEATALTYETRGVYADLSGDGGNHEVIGEFVFTNGLRGTQTVTFSEGSLESLRGLINSSVARVGIAFREFDNNDPFDNLDEFIFGAYPYRSPVLVVTAAVTPTEQIGALLDFIEKSVAAGSLVGSGPGRSGEHRLGALLNMIEAAYGLVDAGHTDGACSQLSAVLWRTDGLSFPPDFVEGEAVTEVAERVRTLLSDSGCETIVGRQK
jgi:hypothetical protein